jgi:hypothetical protein
LYWQPSSRESWRALLPFTLFTENSRQQAWHLKRRRRISQQFAWEQRHRSASLRDPSSG